ncbi:MAG: peptide synthase [Phycisphaerae bacterium]|nr:MAG: AMP-binding protein [Planctomycetia bacterium]RIK71801.1 MAG: peptide synthase [Planctomycetota bacterium]GJQ25507.1 MAG: peptide synthase [Phycisphaerae bacterium]
MPEATAPAPHATAPDALNVSSHLARAAQTSPDQPAIIWRCGHGYARRSFDELNREVDILAHGLDAAGVARGTRTILMARPSAEFFALTFALYRVGAVPVLVDPGMGRRRMVQCLAAIHAEAFVGIPLAHLLRITNPVAFRSVHIAVTIGRRFAWGGWTLDRLRAMGTRAGRGAPFETTDTQPDDPAAIIFTTGSTGPPKAVLFQHRTFDAQVRMLREHFGIRPGEVDLPTFPLFALFDPALGMTAVIPEMDPTRPAMVDPMKILRAIRDNNVTHMFGSPALLNRVGRYGEAIGVKLPSLRRVISAGAAVPPEVLKRFAQMLDESARIHTPYGATEALPVASIDHREILGETALQTADGEGTCVGKPLPDAAVRVIRITDDPIPAWDESLVLPPGQIGEFVVKGPMVTRAYLSSGEAHDAGVTASGSNTMQSHHADSAIRANQLAKIPDGDDLWHRMGDVGWIDERGRLWFCGRKSHRVETPDGVLFTEQVEAIFNQHPAVFRSALVGVGQRTNQRPVVCIELEPSHRNTDRPTLIRELNEMAARHNHTRTIRTFLINTRFPVDIRHNSKIFREKLSVWAAERLQTKPCKPW